MGVTMYLCQGRREGRRDEGREGKGRMVLKHFRLI
jgi:hypothetical protein